MPRIVRFLRAKIETDDRRPHIAKARISASYAGTQSGKYFVEAEPRREHSLVFLEGPGRVTRTDMQRGKITVLADQYDGKPLGEPNDPDADSQGRIYFTSRLSNRDPWKGNVNSVYRIDAPGKVARVLHFPNIDKPNGIVISPDARYSI